jgi:hypothetical protein
MALCPEQAAGQVARALEDAYSRAEIRAVSHVAGIDPQGARVVADPSDAT